MNTTTTVARSPATLDSLFQALADERRREIIGLVARRTDGIATKELATRLTAILNSPGLNVVCDRDRRQTHIELVHRDLPALKDVGVLTETDDGTIVTADHWAITEFGIDEAIESSHELDGVFEALADSRRRTVLSVLYGDHQPLSTQTLAREVAACELDLAGSVPADHIDRVRTSFVHAHLPLLNDAGLIAYDAIEGRIAYEGHPVIRREWIDPDHDQSETDDTTIAPPGFSESTV